MVLGRFNQGDSAAAWWILDHGRGYTRTSIDRRSALSLTKRKGRHPTGKLFTSSSFHPSSARIVAGDCSPWLRSISTTPAPTPTPRSVRSSSGAGRWQLTLIDSLTGARTADLARPQRQRGRQRLRPRFGQFVFRHHLAQFVGHSVS